jgi:hypothetical protein
VSDGVVEEVPMAEEDRKQIGAFYVDQQARRPKQAALALFAKMPRGAAKVSDTYEFSGTAVMRHAYGMYLALQEKVNPVAAQARQQLDEIARSNLAAPLALDRARWILDCNDASPTYVVDTADAGVALYFEGKELLPGGAPILYGMIECLPDGGLVGLLNDRTDDARLESWDFAYDRPSRDNALQRISEFIGR